MLVSIELVNGELLQNEAVLQWLDEWNIEIPLSIPNSRWPTLGELREILDNLVGCEIHYDFSPENQKIDVWDGETHFSIHISSVDGEDVETPLNFDGWHNDLIPLILKRLAIFCGAFLLMFDGEAPQLITAD